MAYLLSIAQDRRTKAQFTASNPVLLADQLAIETDSNVATTGDGTTAYLSIRGNTTLSGDDRRSADDVYAGQTLGDGRDEAGGGDALTSINLNVGPAIELRIPLDARWAQILNAGAPAAGEVEANSDADATAVTSITFHKLDAGTNDQSAWFTQMRVGGNLTVRMTNNDGTNASGSPCIYRITAVPTLASDRYTIAVAYVSGQFIGSLPNWYVSYAGNVDPDVTVSVVTVSGAGEAGANGNYYRNGSRDNKPMYRNGEYFIYWSKVGETWVLGDASGDTYIDNGGVYPWNGTWEVDSFPAPAPTVTDGTATITLAAAAIAALNTR